MEKLFLRIRPFLISALDTLLVEQYIIEMKKKLYIIDGHAHIYSAYYAPMRQMLKSSSGEPTKATYIVTSVLLGLLQHKKPDYIVIALDSKAPSFRNELFPDYKAHRPPMPEDMPQQIKRLEQIFSAMNIPVIKKDGFEADDIIGTLARQASAKDMEVFICSKDKDMLQLLDDNVVLYDVKKDESKDTSWLQAEMGITPKQFVDVLAIQGDTADNIPGIKDVGPKTAIQWIVQYDSIDGLYQHSDEIKGKRGDSLRESKDIAYLCKELVTINTNIDLGITIEELKAKDIDAESLATIFNELGFRKFIEQLSLPAQSDQDQGSLFGGGPSSAKTTKHCYTLVDTEELLNELVAKLASQKAFAFDTETTSIRALEAQLVGLSFSFKAHEAYYIPVKASLGQKTLAIDLVIEKLTPVLKDKNILKVAQNAKYDLHVLNNAGISIENVGFDTMIASYVLHAERQSHSMDNMALDYLDYECIPISELIGKGKNQRTFDEIDTDLACEYAAEDADITWQLYEYLSKCLDTEPQLQKLFNEVEMPMMHVLTQMESNGVSLNLSILRKMSNELADRLEDLTKNIYAQTLTSGFNIDSPKQLSEVLFDNLGLPEIKKRSTDVKVLEELKSLHPAVENIIEYRQLKKLKNTYLDKLSDFVNSRTNKLHASFNQTVTATGRLSSSDPNLQNIPIRSDLGRKIRSAFIATDSDTVILSADYSQIELRVLAHISNDKGLIDAFESDRDIHSFVASQIYGVSIDEVTPDMRARCKAVNFGVIYGQGPFGLSQTIGISQGEAKRFIDDYFTRYSSIKQCMNDIKAKAAQIGYAQTILGRRRVIDGITSKNFNVRSSAERMAVNTTIQGSAADLVKVAMINIQQKINQQSLPIKMILQIHDELVFEVPKIKADEYSDWVKNEMETAIRLTVPLKVDAGYGDSWYVGH